MDATVYVQSLASNWQPLGATTGGVLVPESLVFEHVERGGASTASFVVKRETSIPWDDLAPFTPVMIEIGGVSCWRGRIMRTPKQTGEQKSWQVECEGMYQHLADDVSNRGYVHQGWGKWRDIREVYTDDLFDGAFDVVVGQFGYSWIRVPVGNSAGSGRSGGVIFDAGPGNTIERMVLTYIGGGATNMAIVGRSENTIGGIDESFTIDATPIATGSTTYSRTFSAPRRYVRVFAQASGGTLTGATTAWVRLDSMLLFASATYESGNASILVQSDIIRADASDKLPLVSGDQSKIADTTTVIPHYWPDAFQTIQERWDSLRLFDTAQLRVTDEYEPRLELVTPDSTPVWVYDTALDGGVFEDSSANDGQEIFNQALPVYDTENGGAVATVYTTESGAISFTNSGFETNTTGWSAGSDTTLARVTSQSYELAASMTLTATGTPMKVSAYSESFSAGLISGREYTVGFWFYLAQTTTQVTLEISSAGSSTPYSSAYVSTPATGGWVYLEHTFTAEDVTLRVTTSYTRWHIGAYAASVVAYVDAFSIELAGQTLIDRRGFKRTHLLEGDVSNSTAAAAIADSFLDSRQYPPFKGSLTVSGYLRHYDSGQRIPVAWVKAGDRIMIADEYDPTTGGYGRIGMISRSAYAHDSLQVQLDIDSDSEILSELAGR